MSSRLERHSLAVLATAVLFGGAAVQASVQGPQHAGLIRLTCSDAATATVPPTRTAIGAAGVSFDGARLLATLPKGQLPLLGDPSGRAFVKLFAYVGRGVGRRASVRVISP